MKAAQLDAFGPPRLLADTPRARNTDPETSHLAADDLKASGRLAAQQQLILTAVQRYPGRTSRELAAEINADRHMVARRLPELEPVHVTKGAARPCTQSETRRPAVTWWPR